MAKGDDIGRKKNKANRKKLRHNDSSFSAVSARVAAIIAVSVRHVFTLPTPDDPFNDRQGKKVNKKVKPSRIDKRVLSKEKKSVGKSDTEADGIELEFEKVPSLKNGKKNSLTSGKNVEQKIQFNPGRTKIHMSGKGSVDGHQGGDSENLGRPSKYLIMCLNEILSSLHHDS